MEISTSKRLIAAVFAAIIFILIAVIFLLPKLNSEESAQSTEITLETTEIMMSEEVPETASPSPEMHSQSSTDSKSTVSNASMSNTTVSNVTRLLSPPGVSSEYHTTLKNTSGIGWYYDKPGHNWRYRNALGEWITSEWAWIDTNGDNVAQCYYFDDNSFLVRGCEVDGYAVDASGCWIEDGEIQTLDVLSVQGWNSLNGAYGYFYNGWRCTDMITPDNVYLDEQGFPATESDIDKEFMATESDGCVCIAISKKTHFLEVWDHGEMTHSYVITTGAGDGDKEVSGDDKTPEGEFFVCGKNPGSSYARGLFLNYPNSEDAQRGLDEGLISRAEYDAIVSAEANGQTPPYDTALGGYIEIHGAREPQDNSSGCIELLDEEMIELYDMIPEGTKVFIF